MSRRHSFRAQDQSDIQAYEINLALFGMTDAIYQIILIFYQVKYQFVRLTLPNYYQGKDMMNCAL